MSSEQAEGFADAMAEAIQSDLATKAAAAAVQGEIKESESRLDTRITETDTNGEERRRVSGVTAGLDPAVHLFERKHFLGWIRGSSPRMTSREFAPLV